MVQMVKNLPAMQETWVQYLGWKDLLEKGKATHSSILASRNSMDCIDHGATKSWTRLSDFHFTKRCKKSSFLCAISLLAFSVKVTVAKFLSSREGVSF